MNWEWVRWATNATASENKNSPSTTAQDAGCKKTAKQLEMENFLHKQKFEKTSFDWEPETNTVAIQQA